MSLPLPSGTRLGSYEIVAPLGAGGMGEVYRARDTQLKRDVALKVLPAAFSSDSDRLARFQREAELLATLNHPHIAAIYGLERTGTATALVLELVDGETLAEHIARGPIPMDEAIPIARQIADALESAHERGIIHRDLKPANVKVRPDGTVKVLDFGLAKALDTGDARADPDSAHAGTLSPTMTSPAMTRLGVILGTAAYMAPEQARGRPADRRSDIWAFGCVLYEMLTGVRIFGSEDVSDTLAAVLRAEPDWNALPADTPPRLRLLMQRCLRKDPRQRLPHIGVARLDLDDALVVTDTTATTRDVPRVAARGRWAWVAAATVGLAAAALAFPAVQHLRERPFAPPPQWRVEVSTPPTSDPYSFAISPDARQMIFSAQADGRHQLWLRTLGEASARPLPGTEGGRLPFWSPNSRSIGFFMGAGLHRLDLDGSGPRFLAPVSVGIGGSWNVDNEILFIAGTGLPVRRVSANGGTVATALEFDDNVNLYRFPHFLPDQRHFLILGRGTRSGLYLGSLNSKEVKWLGEADAGGVFIPAARIPQATRGLVPGWVLYTAGGTLFARRFDPGGEELTGDPVVLAEHVDVAPGPLFGAALSVSATGAIAYRVGDASSRQLTWFDSFGKVLGTIDLVGTFSNPEILPDGRIVVELFRDNNTDIWVFDGSRGRPLTTDLARDYFPVAFDQGRRLYFASARSTRIGLFEMPSAGGASETKVAEFERPTVPIDVSPDGRLLLYFTENEQGGPDIGVLSLADRKQSILLGTRFRELWAQFSPDGTWITFQSDETNRDEVYVQPFPVGAPQRVSIDGGVQPRWAHRGTELYFVAPDGYLMAVTIRVNDASASIDTPRRLFRPGIVGGGGPTVGLRQQYDVDARGRFLVNVNVEEANAPPIMLLLNPSALRETP